MEGGGQGEPGRLDRPEGRQPQIGALHPHRPRPNECAIHRRSPRLSVAATPSREGGPAPAPTRDVGGSRERGRQCGRGGAPSPPPGPPSRPTRHAALTQPQPWWGRWGGGDGVRSPIPAGARSCARQEIGFFFAFFLSTATAPLYSSPALAHPPSARLRSVAHDARAARKKKLRPNRELNPGLRRSECRVAPQGGQDLTRRHTHRYTIQAGFQRKADRQ